MPCQGVLYWIAVAHQVQDQLPVRWVRRYDVPSEEFTVQIVPQVSCGEPMSTLCTAIEDVAEKVVRYMCTKNNVVIDDIKHDALQQTKRRLAASKSYQIRHQEAAQVVINKASPATWANIDILQRLTNPQEAYDLLTTSTTLSARSVMAS